MSFLKKTWLARIGVGLNRFRMNNSTDVVLESNPVSVTQQGDQLSADNMNNLETRIDNAFTEMAGNLATIEVSPSLHNWTVGSQIVYNGILYKVTSAISTGDNLVVGSNISPYPVSSAISDISDAINAIRKRYDGKTVAFYVACASQVNGFYSLFIDLGAKYNITVESIKRVGSTTELKSNFSLASASTDIVHLYSTESSYAGTWFSVQLSLVYYQ